MKKILKKITPTFFKHIYYSFSSFYYDFIRYYKFGSNLGINNSEQKYIGHIVKRYHVIEKGLTMPETRLGFGKKIVNDLVRMCNEFIDSYDNENTQLINAVSVLLEYKKFHQQNSYKLSKTLIKSIDDLDFRMKNRVLPQEQINTTKEEYFKEVNSVFNVFSNSRKSIRNYSSDALPISKIIDSVDLVKNTPTSCNRQSNRVYVYTEKDKIRKILEKQGGSRGFLELVDKLIVVVSELGVYEGVRERNQAYVDGGIFVMNLLYALHFNKVVCCVLNCGFSKEIDLALRKITKIKESECFVAMISCGEAKDNFKIAASHRDSIDKSIKIIK